MKKLLLAGAFAVGVVSTGYQAVHAEACSPIDLLNGNLISGKCDTPARGEPRGGTAPAPAPKTLRSGELAVEVFKGPDYVVQISINGSPYFKCMIDTGANDTLIPTQDVEWLIQHNLLNKEDAIGKVKSTLANGASIESFQFIIRELKVSDGSNWVSATNVHAMFNLPTPTKGKKAAQDNSTCLLGASFFYNFKSWKIDNETGKITFEWYQ